MYFPRMISNVCTTSRSVLSSFKTRSAAQCFWNFDFLFNSTNVWREDLIMGGDRRNLSLDLRLYLELGLKVNKSDIYLGAVP